MCHIQVIWKYFYSFCSGSDRDTLYQLRNLIGRTNVSADPTKKYNECNDFFKLIVECHVLVAAFEHLSMKSLSDVPVISGIINPQDLWMAPSDERRNTLQMICDDIVDTFASFKFNQSPAPSSDKVS